jgi:hypothetical protein
MFLVITCASSAFPPNKQLLQTQNCAPLDSGDFTPCESASDFRALRAQR